MLRSKAVPIIAFLRIRISIENNENPNPFPVNRDLQSLILRHRLPQLHTSILEEDYRMKNPRRIRSKIMLPCHDAAS
jgi:hypothetical protein